MYQFWERFSGCFKTKTHDAAGHAWVYLQGLILMHTDRNFANIDRRVTTPDGDGQDLQQFMSDSPWVAQSPIQQVQREIRASLELQHGGVALLDESSDEKAGAKSAGAGRQHNGRLGKIEMSQTGVFLAFYKAPVWTVVLHFLQIGHICRSSSIKPQIWRRLLQKLSKTGSRCKICKTTVWTWVDGELFLPKP